LSAGKAIISTPYLHAVELLDEGRGALVPFDDPEAIAAKTIELLDNGTARHAMRKRAYLYARDMVWNRVAPVETCAALSACLQAYRATELDRWRGEAWTAFNWFLGDNDLQIALYDPTTGGCRDGLHPDRANENQGAESTLSFLMALLEMRKLEDSRVTNNES
jgi:hypothetical protein